jgi:FixJ family two-component response regulator
MKVTDREAQILDSLIANGTHKRAADAMGIRLTTLSARLLAARIRNRVISNLMLVIMWDRHRRGSA